MSRPKKPGILVGAMKELASRKVIQVKRESWWYIATLVGTEHSDGGVSKDEAIGALVRKAAAEFNVDIEDLTK